MLIQLISLVVNWTPGKMDGRLKQSLRAIKCIYVCVCGGGGGGGGGAMLQIGTLYCIKTVQLMQMESSMFSFKTSPITQSEYRVI